LLRTEKVKQIEQVVAETSKRMLGFLGSSATQAIEVKFGFADPANPFNSLRLQYQEEGLALPGEELGLGIQSAMVVGIFEAFRQIGGDFGTLVIEEPEMYLHPQAQRYFFRLLCELTEKGQCQVIYSTHSPIFADVNRYEALRLVRKDIKKQTKVSFVNDGQKKDLSKARDAFKIGGRFDSSKNEVLFARRALLVEGYGDRIAALIVAEKLKLDFDAESIAVVDCGGKSGIELVSLVCKALEIPYSVLHDEDIWPINDITDDEKRKKQEEENKTQEKMNERIKSAVGAIGSLFVISPTLEESLGISRNAADKPKRIAEALISLNLEKYQTNLSEQ